jgi:uncharacterized membrane protein YbhN (UPF0104 family)
MRVCADDRDPLKLPPTTAGQRAAIAIAVLLAVASAWGVHEYVGWTEVARVAASLPSTTWAAFVALMAASYATRVVRVWRLLRDVHAKALLARAVPVFFVHNAIATVLPARLGDAAMPLLARRWIGADWAAAIGALAWWRVGDTAVVAALAVVLVSFGARVLAPLLFVALVACVLPFAVFALRGTLVRGVEQRLARGRDSRWLTMTQRVLRGMPQHPFALAADLALATVAWTTKIGAFTILIVGARPAMLDAVDPARWSQIAAAALAGDVAGALPVPTIGGVGTFEAGIVLGLAALDVTTSDALAIAVLVHGALLASIAVTGVLGVAAGAIVERERHRDP